MDTQSTLLLPCLHAEFNTKAVLARVNCIASADRQVKKPCSQRQHRRMISQKSQNICQTTTLELLQGGRLAGANPICGKLNRLWIDHEGAILICQQHSWHTLNPHLLLRRSDGGRRAHPFKYLERLEPKTSRRWQEHRLVGTPSSENSPVSGKTQLCRDMANRR